MPDEAVLTIRFKDESSPGGSGVATTSPVFSGSDPGSVKVADQQNAITQAGGIGAWAQKSSTASQGETFGPTFAPMPPAQALPMPPVSTIGAPTTDPLFRTAAGIVQADPNVTIAELQKALGIQAGRAKDLFSAVNVPPGGASPMPSGSALPMPPDSLIFPEDWRRLQDDKWIQSEQARFARDRESQAEQEREERARQQAARFIPPPPNEEMIFAQARSRPPPVVNPPGGPQPPPVSSTEGVQAAVNAIAGIAAQGGPLGAAVGRFASATAALPGIGSAAGSVAAAAAPIALASAALAVPATGMLVLRNIADTTRGQIGGLSPELAQAEAEASVRRLIADLRSARTLGDEVAADITNRSRISAASQGIRDNLAEPLLQRMNDVTNAFAIAAEGLDKTVEENKRLYAAMTELSITRLAGPTGKAILDYLRRITENTEKPTSIGNLNLDFSLPKLPPPFEDGESARKGFSPIELLERISQPALGF